MFASCEFPCSALVNSDLRVFNGFATSDIDTETSFCICRTSFSFRARQHHSTKTPLCWVQSHPRLRAAPKTLYYNDGTDQSMLCLFGTIKISIRGALYNIPLDVWFHPAYPATAPVVYVVPTPTMLIKPSRIVDANGLVATDKVPYLHPIPCLWVPLLPCASLSPSGVLLLGPGLPRAASAEQLPG